MSASSKSYSFTAAASGLRVDKFLSENCPDLSRTQAQKLIEEGHVTVNDRITRSSLKLLEGDKIAVIIPPPLPSPLAPEAIPLKVIYEDSDLMVVDKPAGLTVHPAPGHYTHTLVNAILAHVPELQSGEAGRPGIVHRLDKDTSGLIIIAKNGAAHMKLAGQFKERSVSKVYIALVQGHLAPEQGVIEANIGRHPRDRQRMAVVTGGREAQTEYNVQRYLDNYTLLEVKPRTGRTHQIRVHLAAIGFPIVGDAVYGKKVDFLSRQFLHAGKLRFKLPSTGQVREFESPLPPDLSSALDQISKSKYPKIT
jgi:23S rRNA pseudouridine1911/1915/1917 synthase